MMAEYVVMHVPRLHREMPRYQEAQANREWLRQPIVRPEQRRIGFLPGLCGDAEGRAGHQYRAR
jgi:glyoxylate/hydroxypyruvate reductase A